MGTPTWFRFSTVNTPLAHVFRSSAKLRDAHHFKPRGIGRLAWDEVTRQLAFQEDSISPLREDNEATEIASTWDGFSISYDVLSIRAVLYLSFWKQDTATCMAVEIDSQVPYIKPQGMTEGEWLERFICEYIHACGSSECAYGRDWPILFAPLEPEQIVSELRSGMLLKRPLPGFYALAQGLLSKEEMATLLLGQERSSRLRYFHSPAGYYVLSSLCRRNWALTGP
ncbi:MAG: hypothetical protein ACJ8AT_34975 [Hyalangium sp.]|uniref:hypothetical protein n=1 Tax=Hyalangium sp. TaxID=2028555 RepID=UPI003899F9FD